MSLCSARTRHTYRSCATGDLQDRFIVVQSLVGICFEQSLNFSAKERLFSSEATRRHYR